MPAAASQNGLKLNAELAPGITGGDVWSFRFTADGTRLIYLAGQDDQDDNVQEAFELYSAPSDGTQPPVKLNWPLPPRGKVWSFELSPKGDQVVYLATEDMLQNNWVNELFRVPVDGSQLPIKLHPDLVPIHSVMLDYAISPDGAFVVYRANQEEPVSQVHLYSVPVDGSPTPLRISGPFIQDVMEFEIAPDSSRVVYMVQPGVLHSVPLAGGPIMQLSPTVAFSQVNTFHISADASRVVYRADQDTDGVLELYSVPVDGSQSPVKLNGPLLGGDVLSNFRISGGSARVVYTAVEDALPFSDLYSVPIDGSQGSIRLNDPFVTGGGLVGAFDISPDGARVVYRAEQDVDTVVELYRVRTDRSTGPVKLSGTMVNLGDVTSFFIAPDAERVVFRADRETDEVYELYSVPIGGPATLTKLNGPLQQGADISAFYKISPDGSLVAFLADQETNDVLELYVTTIVGAGLPVKVNGPLPPGGDFEFNFYTQVLVKPIDFSPDGSRLAYVLDQDVNNVFKLFISNGVARTKLSGPPPNPDVHAFRATPAGRTVYLAEQDHVDVVELYSVDPSDQPAHVQLNHVLTVDRDVLDFAVSSDASRVVYVDGWHSIDQDIYAVPIDGSAPAVQLNIGLEDVQKSFRISPDSAFVVYLQGSINGKIELFSVPIEGGVAPAKLNAPLVTFGNVEEDFQISNDATIVVYRADQDGNEVFELFSVPIDASLLPTQLNAVLVGAGDVRTGFQVSADSTRVVYTADQDVNELFELYSVLIDGGAPPVQLNPPLVAFGDVEGDFRISPDSAFVVYRAEQDVDERIELYSSSIGGGSPVKLNGAFQSGSDVLAFDVSADGARVVYVADEDADEVFELFSVPSDASSARIQLNGTLVSGGDVDDGNRLTRDFELAGDSSRVVYRADQDVDGTFELYSVPLDGSASAVKVSGPLVAGGDVSQMGFRISPDSSHVIYRADAEVDGRHELYRAPLAVNAPARRVSAPLIAAGDVQLTLAPRQELAFAFSSNGKKLFYLADQDQDEEVELFSSSIRPPFAPWPGAAFLPSK